MSTTRHDSTEVCSRCGYAFEATEWREQGCTVDTAGGMVFDSGWVCDTCLGSDAVIESEIARQEHR